MKALTELVLRPHFGQGMSSISFDAFLQQPFPLTANSANRYVDWSSVWAMTNGDDVIQCLSSRICSR
jgi:hypothetical protein